MMHRSVLEVDSVIFGYGLRRILSNVYVACAQGHVVGLLGRNGSGKSSLLRIMFGTLAAESKSVRIDGISLPGAAFSGGQLSYLPQHGLMPDNITLRAAMRLFGISADVMLDGYPELEKLLKQSPWHMSGGERRLAEVLLILYAKSGFALLDEPFSGLSPVMIERLAITIQRVKGTKGILITDHLHKHVTALSDSLYLLDRGQTRRIRDAGQLVQYGYIPSL